MNFTNKNRVSFNKYRIFLTSFCVSWFIPTVLLKQILALTAYADIGFDKILETISHELAHYIQLVKNGKSSCESDLVLNNGNYNGELAREQEEWTKEIYQLIKQDYSEWETKRQ